MNSATRDALKRASCVLWQSQGTCGVVLSYTAACAEHGNFSVFGRISFCGGKIAEIHGNEPLTGLVCVASSGGVEGNGLAGKTVAFHLTA